MPSQSGRTIRLTSLALLVALPFTSAHATSVSATTHVPLLQQGLDRGHHQAVPARSGQQVSTIQSPLDRIVTLSLHGVTLNAALEAIQKEANVSMLYSKTFIPENRRVTITASQITVREALKRVLEGTDLEVKTGASGQIILAQKQSKEQQGAAATIVGRVSDAKTREPLPGVQVTLDGTRFGAVSGDSGKYSIPEVPPGTYAVSARRLGYEKASQSITVADASQLIVNFSLDKAASTLGQVVVTGTVIPTEVKALPTPISVITAEDIERNHIKRVDEAIRLAVPGAVVWEEGSSQYGGLTNVSIRGTSGLQTYNNNPKMYIDGVEVAISSSSPVDPQSIERIEVLRGPQAAAIYGSDAMAGVIQIFTKRGSRSAHPEVEMRAELGRIESQFETSGALRQEYTLALHGQGGSANYRIGGGYTHVGIGFPTTITNRQACMVAYTPTRESLGSTCQRASISKLSRRQTIQRYTTRGQFILLVPRMNLFGPVKRHTRYGSTTHPSHGYNTA